MEKIKVGIDLLYKFSILWEVLPYYNTFSKWRKLMLTTWKETVNVWNMHENAFKKLSKWVRTKIIEYDLAYDKAYLKYVFSYEVILDYRIIYDFRKWLSEKSSLINKFIKLLDKSIDSGHTPTFYKINTNYTMKDFVAKIYKRIKEWGEDSVDALTQACKFIDSENYNILSSL